MDLVTIALVAAGLLVFSAIVSFFLKSKDAVQNAQTFNTKIDQVDNLVNERLDEMKLMKSEMEAYKSEVLRYQDAHKRDQERLSKLEKQVNKLSDEINSLEAEKVIWRKEHSISGQIASFAGSYTVGNAFTLVRLIFASFFLLEYIFQPNEIALYVEGRHRELDRKSKDSLTEAENLMKKLRSEQIKSKVDFAILTIREDEFRAVLQRFPPASIVKGNRFYSLAYQKPYVVAVVRCFEQGQGEAQDVTRDVISDLDPQWILVVGIAGGVPSDDFSLGDVIVATRVYDLTLEAVQQDRPSDYSIREQAFHRGVVPFVANLPAMEEQLLGWNDEKTIGSPRPSIVSNNPDLFYGPENWQAKVQKSLSHHFDPTVRPPRPLFVCAPIVSSDRLIKDSDILSIWLKMTRHIAALEMEAAGVYRSANGSAKHYPVLAIRGISDIVGFKREAIWTSYACHSAASFALAFIRLQPVEPRNAAPPWLTK